MRDSSKSVGTAGAEPDEKITRDDLRASFAELGGDVEERADAARSTAMVAAAVAGAVVLVAVYMIGRRRGRQKTTLIELRRY